MTSNYWTTAHWPVPASGHAFARHVYVKERHKTFPKADDVVFVREVSVGEGKALANRRSLPSRQARVDEVATRLWRDHRRHDGRGEHRKIAPSDVVYDYGDLSEWSIITCQNFERLRLPLPLPELMASLSKQRDLSPQFLRLYRVRDEHVPMLLKKLGRS